MTASTIPATCTAPLCGNRATEGDRCHQHRAGRGVDLRPAPVAQLPRTAPTPPRAQPTSSGADDPGSADVLLARGRASSIAKVRRAAGKAGAQLAALRDVLAETAEEERQRAERERQQTEAREALEQAQHALEAAREQARAAGVKVKRPGSTSTHAPSGQHVDSRTVRAWARENGVDCPAVGRVPQRVVDQWAASLPTATP